MKKYFSLFLISFSFFLFACNGNEDCGARNPNVPDDHTVQEECAYHKSGLKNPLSETSSCNNCHGDDLKGMGDIPSCYKCHGKKWN